MGSVEERLEGIIKSTFEKAGEVRLGPPNMPIIQRALYFKEMEKYLIIALFDARELDQVFVIEKGSGRALTSGPRSVHLLNLLEGEEGEEFRRLFEERASAEYIDYLLRVLDIFEIGEESDDFERQISPLFEKLMTVLRLYWISFRT